ncbi:MAG: copper chaperone PCu(A)C [Planktomarina sp.]
MKTTLIAALVLGLSTSFAVASDMKGHQMHMADDSMPAVTSGDLVLTKAFAFATLPNQPVGGGFVTVENTGAVDDVLIKASSPSAGYMEIHMMEVNDGVMVMREMADGLPIPAGETVVMKPGGYHIMFMDLPGPLVADEMATVTLTFQNAGDVTVTLPIKSRIQAMQGQMKQMGH